jgi:preprotein translocase subunit Sec61beta
MMPNPNKPDPNLVKLSPETVLAIAVAAILIPLLITGFISQ